LKPISFTSRALRPSSWAVRDRSRSMVFGKALWHQNIGAAGVGVFEWPKSGGADLMVLCVAGWERRSTTSVNGKPFDLPAPDAAVALPGWQRSPLTLLHTTATHEARPGLKHRRFARCSGLGGQGFDPPRLHQSRYANFSIFSNR